MPLAVWFQDMDATGAERRTCSNCGTELNATANFCPSCGAAQRPDPEIPEGPPPPLPEPGRIETPQVPGIPPPPLGAANPPNYRQLLSCTGAGCGLILVVALLAGLVSGLGGGGSQDETASVEATAEETTDESAEESTEENTRPLVTGSRVKESTRGEETTAPPRPRTPEERLRRAIEDVFTLTPEEGPQDLEDLQIQNRNGQCYDVYVKFKGDSLTASWTVWNIETRMEQVYKAAYLERDLADRICTVRVESTADLTDNRGNITTETAYITSLDRATAATLNWSNVSGIDFPSVWTVEYEHPTVTQQKAQDALEQARDCMDDGGLFDFDWLQCP